MTEDLEGFVNTPVYSKRKSRWHPDDPVKFSVVLRDWSLDFPWDRVTPLMRSALEKGRLTMKCSHCKTKSLAGPYCFKCYRMVLPELWEGTEKGMAHVARTSGRKRGRPSKADLERRKAEDESYA